MKNLEGNQEGSVAPKYERLESLKLKFTEIVSLADEMKDVLKNGFDKAYSEMEIELFSKEDGTVCCIYPKDLNDGYMSKVEQGFSHSVETFKIDPKFPQYDAVTVAGYELDGHFEAVENAKKVLEALKAKFGK